MDFLLRIADATIGKPLMVHPQKLEVLAYILGSRIGLEGLERPTEEANAFVGQRSADGKYRVVGDTAIIPVHGTLVNRGAFIGSYSGMTSYEGFVAQCDAVAANPKLAHAVLDMDSPGGQVNGITLAVDAVNRLKAKMPVTTYVNDLCASAAYMIAAHSTSIVVNPTSIVGSIGVVMMHVDKSVRLENEGMKVTYIMAGARKRDGNSAEPLPDDVRVRFQVEVDQAYGMFLSSVADGRAGKFTYDAARNTEAALFNGHEAIALGMADRIGTLDSVLSRAPQSAVRPLGARALVPRKDKTMDDEKIYTQAELDAQVKSAAATATSAGEAAAAARIKAIMALDEAKGREKQAQAIAFNTALSAEDAKGILSAGAADAVPTPAPAPEAAADPAPAPVAQPLRGDAVAGVRTQAAAPPKASDQDDTLQASADNKIANLNKRRNLG